MRSVGVNVAIMSPRAESLSVGAAVASTANSASVAAVSGLSTSSSSAITRQSSWPSVSTKPIPAQPCSATNAANPGLAISLRRRSLNKSFPAADSTALSSALWVIASFACKSVPRRRYKRVSPAHRRWMRGASIVRRPRSMAAGWLAARSFQGLW